MVIFAYFLSDFSSSRSSHTKLFCKKSVFIEFKGKLLRLSPLIKLLHVLKGDPCTGLFLWNLRVFQKQLCFVEPLQTYIFGSAIFHATFTSLLLNKIVLLNHLYRNFWKYGTFLSASLPLPLIFYPKLCEHITTKLVYVFPWSIELLVLLHFCTPFFYWWLWCRISCWLRII